MKRSLIVSVGLIACFLFAFSLYYYFPAKEDRTFKEQIFPVQPKDLRWAVEVDEAKKQKLLQLLDQPFFFLDQGKQMAAFISQDRTVVLKFLRSKSLEPSAQIKKLPDFFPFQFFKERENQEKRIRKEALFSSILLSYQVIPEETGTLFVHITQTKPFKKKVHILDSEQIPLDVNLDEVQWVLQERAVLIRPELARLMWEGKVEEAKARIDQIFSLLVNCAKKRVVDVDPNLVRNDNIGFLKDRAIYIDTGKLRLSSEIPTKSAFALDLKRLSTLEKWVCAHFPELGRYFKEKKAEVLKDW